MRIEKTTVKSGLTIDVHYKCSSCGHDNRFYHYITSESTQIYGNAEYMKQQQRAHILSQARVLADNKNPDIYPKANIHHNCRNCGNAQEWCFSPDTKKKHTIACILITAFCFLLVLIITHAQPIWTLSLPLFVPVVYGITARFLKRKKIQRLKSLPEEYFPTFRLDR